MSRSVYIVIPARMNSKRFPAKPLAFINKKMMLQRVWEIANKVKGVNQVLIATDSENLREIAENFGAKVIMTSSSCLTGTDRVAEVASLLGKEEDIFFNLQGDAVLTPSWVIQSVIDKMVNDPSTQIATPAVRLENEALQNFLKQKEMGSSTGTTVVFDLEGKALYFSKLVIPFVREEKRSYLYRHIGLYGYRKDILSKLASLKETPLEKLEKLEQLRALEHGIPIQVVEVDYKGRTHASVDQPADIAIVEELIEKEGELV
ncbi:MAG: 3-deoxy-manno-octulosonate cytidylyltransferase [Rhabdochlamydiaceae bacterium]